MTGHIEGATIGLHFLEQGALRIKVDAAFSSDGLRVGVGMGALDEDGLLACHPQVFH